MRNRRRCMPWSFVEKQLCDNRERERGCSAGCRVKLDEKHYWRKHETDWSKEECKCSWCLNNNQFNWLMESDDSFFFSSLFFSFSSFFSFFSPLLCERGGFNHMCNKVHSMKPRMNDLVLHQWVHPSNRLCSTVHRSRVSSAQLASLQSNACRQWIRPRPWPRVSLLLSFSLHYFLSPITVSCRRVSAWRMWKHSPRKFRALRHLHLFKHEKLLLCVGGRGERNNTRQWSEV